MSCSNNKYHVYLDIPVAFSYPTIALPDPQQFHHAKIHRSQLGKDFVEWVYSLGLVLRDGINAGEYFYVPPHGVVPIHTDKHYITDVTKLNWLVLGESSRMEWYELNDGKTLSPPTHTELKTAYASADPQDVTRVCSANIGSPSLVNVGRLHGFTNGAEPSHVYCVFVDNPNTGQRLQWDEAVKYFHRFIRHV